MRGLAPTSPVQLFRMGQSGQGPCRTPGSLVTGDLAGSCPHLICTNPERQGPFPLRTGHAATFAISFTLRCPRPPRHPGAARTLTCERESAGTHAPVSLLVDAA